MKLQAHFQSSKIQFFYFWSRARLYRDAHGKMLKLNKNFVMNDEFISKLNIISKVTISRKNLSKIRGRKWNKKERKKEKVNHIYLSSAFKVWITTIRIEFVVWFKISIFTKALHWKVKQTANKTTNIWTFLFCINLMKALTISRYFWIKLIGIVNKIQSIKLL